MSIRIIPNRFDESPIAFRAINKCFSKAGQTACAALKQYLEGDVAGFRFMGDLLVLENRFNQLMVDYTLFRKYVPDPESLKGPYVVIISADTLRWHHVDTSLQRYLGYNLSELENDWVVAYHPETCEEADEGMTQILREFHQGNRQYSELKIRYQTKPGYSVWGQVTFSLVRDWKGNPEYYMMVIRDVSMMEWTKLFYDVLCRLKGLMEASGYYSSCLRNLDGLLRHYDGEQVERNVMTGVHAMVSDITN